MEPYSSTAQVQFDEPEATGGVPILKYKAEWRAVGEEMWHFKWYDAKEGESEESCFLSVTSHSVLSTHSPLCSPDPGTQMGTSLSATGGGQMPSPASLLMFLSATQSLSPQNPGTGTCHADLLAFCPPGTSEPGPVTLPGWRLSTTCQAEALPGVSTARGAQPTLLRL